MTLIEVEILKKYFENENKQGELFIDNVWIRSNKHYVFFGEENPLGKTFALFSKKFYMTVELSKDKNVSLVLDRIAEVIDIFRSQQGLSISKYEFWLPHCIVNGNIVGTKLIAESYGVTRELALEYLITYDDIFSKIFDSNKYKYFGLPLLCSFEEAEKYTLSDNTRAYLKGLKKLNKLLK